MEKQNAKQNMCCRGKLLPVLLLLCVALILTFGFALAKYVRSTDVAPAEADAAKFYFTSDLLVEETAERSSEENIHHISYFDFNAATFPIELYNYKDELNISQVPISGVIECWVGQEKVETEFTLEPNQNGDPVTQKITLVEQDDSIPSYEGLPAYFPNIEGDARVIVRVVAKEPYDKVLTATFQMHWFDDSITLSVSDSEGSNAAMVTLETGILGGAGTAGRYVMITYPIALIPDAVDTRLTGRNTAITGDTAHYTVKTTALYGDNKYTFIFYKTKPEMVYTANMFTVAVYDNSNFSTVSKTPVKYE